MAKRIRAAFFVLLAALALFGGAGTGWVSRTAAQEPAPTPTLVPIVTGNIPVIAIAPELCFLLAASRESIKGPSCQQFDTSPESITTIVNMFGNAGDGLQPADFAGIDLDGNQVHQMDDWANNTSNNGSLWIIAFVSTDQPVDFETNKGVFVPPASPAPGVPHSQSDDVASHWSCDSTSGQTSNSEDEDCDGDGIMGDGVVVARLRSRYGDNIPSIGPGTVSIYQGTDRATINFRVVGEPRILTFTTLETTIQNGIGDLNGDADLSDRGECPLATDSAGFFGALGTPEKSIVLAIARDIEGNAVTGAIINWKTDDPNKAVMAAGLTPTLDLGSFGFGAPNLICGTKIPGKVTVTADISRDVVTATARVNGADPGAIPSKKTVEFTVVGVPASITLTAAPSELNCDGVGASTITATVLDAAGAPVAGGQEVHFDVQVLGNANPITAKVGEKGVATSAVTPFASNVAGVPVVVAVDDLQASVLISCNKGAPSAPAAQPPTGAAAGAGAPSSAVSPSALLPRSGDAALRWSSTMPAWVYLLAAGALGLMMFSAASTVRAKRQ